MQVTNEEFESLMTRLDNDPTCDAEEKLLILKMLRECETAQEFNDWIKTIEVPAPKEDTKESE
jgi:hypothetical protein